MRNAVRIDSLPGEDGEPPRLRDDRIVYGVFAREGAPSDVVFIPRLQAEHTAGMFRAFCTAETWGELRRALNDEQAADLAAWLHANEGGLHLYRRRGDEHAFHPDDIPGLFEGDWPPWPDQLHLSWLPPAVIEGYGAVEHSVHNGPLASFDAEDEAHLVRALEAHGYTVIRDDDLVAHACGYVTH